MTLAYGSLVRRAVRFNVCILYTVYYLSSVVHHYLGLMDVMHTSILIILRTVLYVVIIISTEGYYTYPICSKKYAVADVTI